MRWSFILLIMLHLKQSTVNTFRVVTKPVRNVKRRYHEVQQEQLAMEALTGKVKKRESWWHDEGFGAWS